MPTIIIDITLVFVWTMGIIPVICIIPILYLQPEYPHYAAEYFSDYAH